MAQSNVRIGRWVPVRIDRWKEIQNTLLWASESANLRYFLRSLQAALGPPLLKRLAFDSGQVGYGA